MSRLSLHRVSYTYPGADARTLREVSLSLDAGMLQLVLGANEAGKSTLLLAMTGFVPHVLGGDLQGDIVLDGRNLTRKVHSEWVRHAGLVFSEPRTQLSGVRATVFEEVAFGLENFGVPPSEIKQRVAAVLGEMGIGNLSRRAPAQLSGGEQQRVALAAILVLATPLLALDEPTAHLDPASSRALMERIARLAAGGRMIALATHQLETVAHREAAATLLKGGRVEAHGTAQYVLGKCNSAEHGVNPPLSMRLMSGEAFGRRLPPEVRFEPTAPCSAALEDVHHRYPNGAQALRGIDLVFEPGTVTALMGANGSGKTTLIRLLNGLLRPSSGRILIAGKEAAHRPIHELAALVGIQFQNPDDQIFASTVADEVAFGPRQLGVSEPELKRLVDQMLLATGLEGFERKQPFDLHATHRRLLALASTLAMKTPVVALDEPGAGFDAHQTRRLEAIIRDLRAAGRTVILITHDSRLAAETTDRVVVLEDGRVAIDGGARDVLTDSERLARLGLEPPPVVRVAGNLGPTPAPLRESEIAKPSSDFKT